MKKSIVTNNGESLIVTSKGYKDIIRAYNFLGCSLWRTIWESDETTFVTCDNIEFEVKRKFIKADDTWFELDQQNRPGGCGYCILP